MISISPLTAFIVAHYAHQCCISTYDCYTKLSMLLHNKNQEMPKLLLQTIFCRSTLIFLHLVGTLFFEIIAASKVARSFAQQNQFFPSRKCDRLICRNDSLHFYQDFPS